MVHLGEAQRKALLLADEQRRAMRKEEAVTKNRGFRDRLVSSFRKANEVNNKLQLQFLEKERREERQRLEETVVEVHAALLLAREGAAAHNQEKIDPGAELKKVVGSILFGEEVRRRAYVVLVLIADTFARNVAAADLHAVSNIANKYARRSRRMSQ